MKKQFLNQSIMIVFIITLLIASCSKKDHNIIKKSNNSNNTMTKQGYEYIPNISSCYSGVSLQDGYIKFNSFDDLQNTLECLESKTGIMNDAFLEDWGHLNDTLLTFKAEEINFHTDLVYQQFENHFSFHNSLRKKQNDYMNLWLSTEPLDTAEGNIPGHFIGDKEFQTVIADNGVFNIADTLYFILEVGDYFRIINGDLNILDSLLNGIWLVGSTNPNVEVYTANGDGPRSSCKGTDWTKTKWQYNFNAHYAMTYSSGFYNIYPRVLWYAKSNAYYSKNGFKSLITNLTNEFSTTRISGSNCNGNSSPNQKSCTVKKSSHTCGNGLWNSPSRWNSGAHIGYHTVSIVNVNAYTSSPTW